MKTIFIIIGLISFVIGIIGVVLPIIPTTPFFLLTGFCFMKGSKKLNDKFVNSKIYKNKLESFCKYRIMTFKSIVSIFVLVSLIFILLIYFTNNITLTIILNIILCLKALYFIFRVKVVSRVEYLRVRGGLC